MDHFFAPDAFETDRFTLRSYRPGDGAALTEATESSYEHLKAFMPWAQPQQPEEVSEKLARQFRARWLLSEDFVIGIWSPDGARLLGGCGFHLREGPLASRNAEIGMWIRADAAGQGYGTDALRALLRWGFSDEWPWMRLTWRCDTRNVASIRLAEKVGLQREGVLRSHLVASDDVRRDTVCFAALRGEANR